MKDGVDSIKKQQKLSQTREQEIREEMYHFQKLTSDVCPKERFHLWREIALPSVSVFY